MIFYGKGANGKGANRKRTTLSNGRLLLSQRSMVAWEWEE